MTIILNIGLARPDGRAVTPGEAVGCVHHFVGNPGRRFVADSDTEPTLVVEVDTAAFESWDEAWIKLASDALGQDCIAAWRPDLRQGRLIGSRAAAWGDFNPAFFIGLDGKRLA